MKLIHLIQRTFAIAFAMFILASLNSSFAQTPITIPINAKQTYLRTNQDPSSLNAVPIDLAALGFTPGTNLRLTQLGTFTYYNGCPDCNPPNPPLPETATAMIGIFSSTDTLLPASQLDRVPGAVRAINANSVVTDLTLMGNLPTDVPKDFLISEGNASSVNVVVPFGARYLFVSARDSFYGDNGDSNNDFAIQISSACPVSALTPITDPLAQQFENGNTLNTALLAPAMQTAYNNFKNAVAASGGNLTLNSAYRPSPYQLHLREVWDKWQALKSSPLPQCQTLRTQVQIEVNRHGIGNLKTHPAGANGPHTQGLAIDVNFAATGLPTQTTVNLGAQNGLIRPLVAKDPVHFILGSQFVDGTFPIIEEDGEEVEQGADNAQAIPIASVFVTVTKRIVNNNYVYSYRVRNNDPRPILAFEVGYNDATNASQLIIPPVGWSYDTGLSPESTTSPASWSSNLITTEESEFHSIEWRTEAANQNIQPLQTMSGFSVVLPQDDATYKTSSIKIVFADGNVAVAQISPATLFDFDGDGRTDPSVFRPSTGYWYLLQSTAGFLGTQFGTNGDKIVPGDYDGDGNTDTAVFRPSNGYWYILNSSDGAFLFTNFGQAGDVPAVGDFDGDGRADICVFRPSAGTFYLLYSSDNSFHFQPWGASGDAPVMGDYDGDGKTDFTIFRSSASTFYILRSTDGAVVGQQFGQSGDKPVVADFDGDGKTDICVYRPSTGGWYYLQSTDNSFKGVAWGANGDLPAAGDYDGDGMSDVAIFRPSTGTFYILQSANNALRAEQFGTNGDAPIPTAYVP